MFSHDFFCCVYCGCSQTYKTLALHTYGVRCTQIVQYQGYHFEQVPFDLQDTPQEDPGSKNTYSAPLLSSSLTDATIE